MCRILVSSVGSRLCFFEVDFFSFKVDDLLAELEKSSQNEHYVKSFLTLNFYLDFRRGIVLSGKPQGCLHLWNGLEPNPNPGICH